VTTPQKRAGLSPRLASPATRRAQGEASESAADDAWVTLQVSGDVALETTRTDLDIAWLPLDEANS
jgi:hypothetical protein